MWGTRGHWEVHRLRGLGLGALPRCSKLIPVDPAPSEFEDDEIERRRIEQ